MATNIIVARGGVEYVPPISLAFWRWLFVFLILFPFFYSEIYKKRKFLKKEFFKLFFLGLMGCGVCGAFPFIAGMSTTMANMGIIYTSSPVFIIILSVFLFREKIGSNRIIGLIICLVGVIAIITKGNKIRNTKNHLQKANEIGGTYSTPPLATIIFVAINIGCTNNNI